MGCGNVAPLEFSSGIFQTAFPSIRIHVNV